MEPITDRSLRLVNLIPYFIARLLRQGVVHSGTLCKPRVNCNIDNTIYSLTDWEKETAEDDFTVKEKSYLEFSEKRKRK